MAAVKWIKAVIKMTSRYRKTRATHFPLELSWDAESKSKLVTMNPSSPEFRPRSNGIVAVEAKNRIAVIGIEKD